MASALRSKDTSVDLSGGWGVRRRNDVTLSFVKQSVASHPRCSRHQEGQAEELVATFSNQLAAFDQVTSKVLPDWFKYRG